MPIDDGMAVWHPTIVCALRIGPDAFPAEPILRSSVPTTHVLFS